MAISRKSKVRNYKSKKLLTSFLAFASLLFLLTNCSYKKEIPPPADLITEDKMIRLIADLSVSESIYTNEPLATLNDTIKRINVLKGHKYTNKQFLSSMRWYSQNPSKLQAIYQGACDILKTKLQEADSLKK
jgi:hypothetical protein